MVRFTIRGLLFVTLVVGSILGLRRRNRDSVPRLFREKAIACDTFAESVNQFVNLGEKEAVAELERLAWDDTSNYQGGWSAKESIGWRIEK